MTLIDKGSKTALLTVDLQFLRETGAAVGETLRHYLRVYREAGKPIIHAVGGAGILQATRADEVMETRFLPAPGIRVYGDYLAQGFLQRLGPNEVAVHKP